MTDLFLGDTREVTTEHLQQQHHLETALVVEDEDGWTLLPKVLLSLDSEIDTRGRRSYVSPYRAHDVERFALGTVEKPHGGPHAH